MHSSESKEKIALGMPNRRAVVVLGITYPSVRAAARATGVPVMTLTYRLGRWEGYAYV
jgi:hypothetical protein